MKRNALFAIIIMVGTCLLNLSCKKNLQQPDVLHDIILPANAPNIVKSNTDFAFDFLHSTLQNDAVSTNKMISPLSIYLALSMLYNGADNATRDSIQYALRLNGTSIEDLNYTCKALQQQMTWADNQVTLSIANSIWYDKSLQPLQSFLNVNDNFYNAEVQPLDFKDPNSVNTINNWVSKQTNGKINQIIDKLDGIAMYLIDAVYFKGSWKFAFDKSKTANASFTTGNGNITSSPFMALHDSLHYLGNDSLQMVQLPYGGGNFNMYVLLPNNNIPIKQFASLLNRTSFANWQARLSNTTIQLYMPKFQYSYSILDMKPELSAMGMGIAFGANADLTKIYTQGALVSKAIHKTYINVDETGTEAAAVTAIGIAVTSAPSPIVMQINHPFMYVIQEKTSGVILFIGMVNDPAQS
jgi:serpin B